MFGFLARVDFVHSIVMVTINIYSMFILKMFIPLITFILNILLRLVIFLSSSLNSAERVRLALTTGYNNKVINNIKENGQRHELI